MYFGAVFPYVLGTSATVRSRAFKKLPAGMGGKGPRMYSWARIPVHLPSKAGAQSKVGWLMIRRSLTDPTDCEPRAPGARTAQDTDRRHPTVHLGRPASCVVAWQPTYRGDVPPDDSDTHDGRPVGRRVVLSLLFAGAAGIAGGSRVQDFLTRSLSGLELRDPTGLIAELPVGNAFRYYSVTHSVPNRDASSYRLDVSGLVSTPAGYRLADLEAMPQTTLVRDFQCVTGWRVEQVHWQGVRLSHLLDAAGPLPSATALRFRSFDGTYTESLTLEQARQPDVIVALRMLGKPVTHAHGGPVRMYVASMYGYKSTKWLSGIELTDRVEPGFWEERGYDVDGYIGRSNGR